MIACCYYESLRLLGGVGHRKRGMYESLLGMMSLHTLTMTPVRSQLQTYFQACEDFISGIWDHPETFGELQS